MERVLKIYRASAGSGKTFTLALEYIKLLVENPGAYRSILAVTFTNKATGEMKERILSKLYGIAHNSKSASDYMEKLVKQMPGYSREQIMANAKKAFELLMHDYGHFRIQTIDAFFQSVLRSLAKELDLGGDMEISLEGKEMLNNAVDTFIKNLEPDTADIAQVIRYIEERLKEGKAWRVNESIKEFSENLLSEEYQQRGDQLRKEIEMNNGEALHKFYDTVNRHYEEIVAKAKRIGRDFFTLAEGCTEKDFTGGQNGIWNNFTKMSNGIIDGWKEAKAKLAYTPEKIPSKGSKFKETEKVAALIAEAIPLYREKLNCEFSLRHYHQLGMLNNIAETLQEENARENRFLLAETSHLLSAMIEKNATFIFEKIGTEINHIFIDEFQDTSKLQWTCFKVLLEEVLARGNFNLIVGDVKQSIYRWRNSDWNIMNNIGKEFNEGTITFASQDAMCDGEVFKSTNYRSDRRIINFNNRLYKNAIASITASYDKIIGAAGVAEIAQAYSDVGQAVPEKDRPQRGYAEIRKIEYDTNEEKFIDASTRELMATLHTLIEEKGIAPKDITILLRKKKEVITKIVDEFRKEFPNLKIISDEAYKLSSSLAVTLVVAALRYIATPEDTINATNLARLYSEVAVKSVLNEDIAGEPVTRHLPGELAGKLEILKELPLYELVEQIIALLNLSSAGEGESIVKDEEAYIYAFLDELSKYISTRSGDINNFLAAWDESISEKCIPSENADSVRIMTVHSSKGLEFHTVIIPLCDWPLTGESGTLLWCEPNEAPYNSLCLLPITTKKEMTESIFSNDYYKEYLYQIVDNLNILYVATTRAKSNLILFTNSNGGRGENVTKLINSIIANMTVLEDSAYDERRGIFTYGSIVPSEIKSEKEKAAEKEKREKNDNPFEAESTLFEQPFVYYDSNITFCQSNELENFLAENEEDKKQYDYIEEGKLLHLVMQGIETGDDVSRTLDRIMTEGLITTAKQYGKIEGLVERALSNPKVKNWFNGTYTLYNECAILGADGGKSRRPDRVMIKGSEAIVVDYKFGREDEKYNDQVRKYMELLKELGYTDIKGYLWYVYKNSIKPVTL